MRKIGGILLAVGLGILIGWGLYWFFRLAFLSMPLPAKIAIAAAGIARQGEIQSIQRRKGEI